MEETTAGVSVAEECQSEDPAVKPLRSLRQQVCKEGTRCKDRSTAHLSGRAHPFDTDYANLCHACGHEPEAPSLKTLFDWVDVDNSGRISRAELEEALPLLGNLFGELVTFSADAWERLDEDGNGLVNFSEFAEWAGPRLGLPLGVQHLFEKEAADHCGIMGCPCTGYSPLRREGRRLQQLREYVSMLDFSERAKNRLESCICGHKKSAHVDSSLADNHAVPYPPYWTSNLESLDRGNVTDINALPELGEDMITLFQQVFDDTYRNKWTRDRRKHNPSSPNVPHGYKVTRAFRCENTKLWREYVIRRAQIGMDRADSKDDSFLLYTDIKTVRAWAAYASGPMAQPLRADCNEWYLFHGTNHQNAVNICENDFKIGLAGGNTGTLYGRGTYFAESITKADEYSKPNEQGEHVVLLCKVLGGRVNYTDALAPHPEALVRSCVEGPYDCIMGDRERCRGTYREFVFYDTENLYAEYIIYYRRLL